MSKKLYGVVPPMITPFGEDGELNEDAIRAVVNFEVEHVHGLFICGTYGGGPLMDTDEKKRVIDIVTEEVNGRVEIVVNVAATTTKTAVELAKHGERAGANRVASTPPFYYVHPMDDVMRYFGGLIDAVSLPVYAYNNPGAVGYGLSIDDVGALQERGLFGIKDSSFDIMWHDSVRRAMPDTFDLVMGTEAMFLPASVLGTQAFIPGLGNAYPDILRRLFDQAMEKDLTAAYETHKLVQDLRSMMKICGPTLVGVTEMAWLRGINAGYPRAPFARAGQDKVKKLQDALVAAGVL